MELLQFRIAARGLLIVQDKLLLVSDDGEFWYTPGGRIEIDETLPDCVKREVYEETGLDVKTGELLYTLECFDVKHHCHSIHFFFNIELIKGNLSNDWNDVGGTVRYNKFFDLNEIKSNKNIVPRFLANGNWLHHKNNSENPRKNVYQGAVKMFGCKMLDVQEECV